MIGFITLVLILQLAGELIARWLGLPVPGPVIGMVLLFIGLSVRGEPPAELANLAHGLLRHLSLLFVPAGVGVISYIGLLAEAWLPITLTLITSVLLAIVVTGVTLRLLQRGDEAPDDG